MGFRLAVLPVREYCRPGLGGIIGKFLRPWWGESAHEALEQEGFSVGARVYRALAADGGRRFFLINFSGRFFLFKK